MNTISKFSENYFSKYFLGNDSEWGTPVPIPNTEVKPLNADDSECENRKLPRIFLFKKRVLQKSRTFFLKKKEKNWYNEKEQKEEKRRFKKVKKN